MITRRHCFRAGASALATLLSAQERPLSSLVYPGTDGRLQYRRDELGNRIPDFSACGYLGGGAPIPEVAVKATVLPTTGDATARIQAAIDAVSGMELDEAGFRGAVLLTRGRYEIGGVLRIAATGVVLRGEGRGTDGTVLYATGRQQRTLIEIRGTSSGRVLAVEGRITAEYVPVGETAIPVASVGTLRPGDTVIVRRISNAAWISAIAMDRITPRPDDPGNTVQWTPFNLDFERHVVAVEDGRVTLDAPITCAIEQRWGGGEIRKYDESTRIWNVGIEHMSGVSEFDPSVQRELRGTRYFADERHAWSFIGIENANNVWVREIDSRHFGFACVDIGRARWVTVRDCDNRDMVSEITGSRRYSYNVEGQLCLIERCDSDSGRHDFVVGARICGPNAFVDCTAGVTYAMSEPHHRWSVGGLYDNVRAPIAIQ
ncbi:MAG: hypothetical protein JNL98_33970, partial [Bryobacterales bacterium]|nr:hypothetical protein [Bryobacterales bacterium]